MLDQLNQSFGLDQALRFSTHASGLIQGLVQTEACQASFFLLGGHLAEFQPHGEEPVLFMSAESQFEVGKAIRGGVPICFPWFGPNTSNPSAPSHGTVRTAMWDVTQTSFSDGIVSVNLRILQEPFDLDYSLRFGSELDLRLSIKNTSSAEQRCELALHSYFRVSDISQVLISGLESLPFLDKLTSATVAASGKPLRFEGETDSVYQGVVQKIAIRDDGFKRVIRIIPQGSQSTVVWNPWIAKSKRMPDFGDQEYHRMCCVETANISPHELQLSPGGQAKTGVTIAVDHRE